MQSLGDEKKLHLYVYRDHDLHRLLFLPNGLPDGTELAYYMKGQVCYRRLNLRIILFILGANVRLIGFANTCFSCRIYCRVTSKEVV